MRALFRYLLALAALLAIWQIGSLVLGEFMIFLVEPLRAGPRDDEDLVARGQGNEQDAGQIPEPEQGQEQGEQHDLGQRIGQKDHRGQRIVHGTDMA